MFQLTSASWWRASTAGHSLHCMATKSLDRHDRFPVVYAHAPFVCCLQAVIVSSVFIFSCWYTVRHRLLDLTPVSQHSRNRKCRGTSTLWRLLAWMLEFFCQSDRRVIHFREACKRDELVCFHDIPNHHKLEWRAYFPPAQVSQPRHKNASEENCRCNFFSPYVLSNISPENIKPNANGATAGYYAWLFPRAVGSCWPAQIQSNMGRGMGNIGCHEQHGIICTCLLIKIFRRALLTPADHYDTKSSCCGTSIALNHFPIIEPPMRAKPLVVAFWPPKKTNSVNKIKDIPMCTFCPVRWFCSGLRPGRLACKTAPSVHRTIQSAS